MSDLTITVKIADRPYRLTIGREEEANLRKAVDEIEVQMKKYAGQYAFKDRQDLLAMVALQFAVHAIELQSEIDYRDNNIGDSLVALNKTLDRHLS